jgi:hypothetical protein
MPRHPTRTSTESEITTNSAPRFIMCAMSEGSLPPFGTVWLRSFTGTVKRALGRLLKRRRREEPDPALLSRASSAIREYADAHATLFERAERLREKAERLERAGTPSESARNRAERARREVEAGLAALRASFAGSISGRAGRRAFDRELKRRYPRLEVSDQSL